MTQAYLCGFAFLACFVPSISPAQTVDAPAGQPPLSPAELQQASVAKMMQSVALQEVSVRKQAPGPPPKFFLLPPPAATPGVVPYSATVAPFADCDPLPSAQIDAVVERAATAQSVDPDLLRSVIRQESAFRPCSVSVKGAVGLMQLMPATINQFSVSDPFDPMKNVDAGAKLLKQLLNKYSGDLARALAAYNAGTVPVDSAGAVPDIPETLNYVKKILSDLPAKKD